MKRYMSVQVIISKESCLRGARIYYSDSELDLKLSYNTSYEKGMEELRKLEKRLGKVAQLITNQFDPKISYKELYGYIDRE